MKLGKNFAVALSAIAIAIVGISAPAKAAATNPTDLYYPNGASCSMIAPGQLWVDSGNTQVNSITGVTGDTVTIHNLCTTAAIWVGSTAGSRTQIAALGQAVYTLPASAASVQAYNGNAGLDSLVASASIMAPPDVTTTGSNTSTTLSTSSISTANNAMFTILNNGSNTLMVNGLTGGVRWGGQTCTSFMPCTINASASLPLTVIAQGTIRVGSTTLTIGSGSGGGGSSTSAPAPTETLSLQVSTSGATCTGGNPSGVAGSWLTLPGADTCTQSGPTAKAGAVLLGWSTTANFPIARAQAQIDKHWGVIDEVIDGVRMIFIPGGMATYVSGSNNLYPVWSK